MKLLDALRIARLGKPFPGPLKYRSSARGTLPAHPRHLTKELKPWPNFFKEVKDYLAPYLQYDYPNLDTFPSREAWEKKMNRRRYMTNEGFLARYLQGGLYEPCEDILHDAFNIHGSFAHDQTLNAGRTDTVLTFDALNKHPQESGRGICVIEQKTPWDLPITSETDVVEHYRRQVKVEPDNIVKAIHQLHGYMTFNCLKYGALSNAETLLLFRRVHASKSQCGGVLECSPPIAWDGVELESQLAALIYVANLTYKDGWFRHDDSMRDERLSRTPDLSFDDIEKLSAPLSDSKWRETTEGLSFRLTESLAWDKSSSSRAQVIEDGKAIADVVLKIYSSKFPEAWDGAVEEARIYERLSDLQGTCVPRLYTTGTVWGLLSILILEDCGDSLRAGWKPGTTDLAKRALTAIHDRGVCHSDIALQNIVYKVDGSGSGELRIIDFGEARVEDDGEVLRREVRELEALEPEHDGEM
ncbi:hypothetical protein TWF696_001875 [Orbilia brochopaga]|uniref:non-specific serine/threonine protein kinase n=1 Tax=Orbilia brochopaga TaxID=3140254 RepID=A0AAV9UA32_9PEZI